MPEQIQQVLEKNIKVYFPDIKLSGDNGAMIGAQGYFEFLRGNTANCDLNAVATLPIDFCENN